MFSLPIVGVSKGPPFAFVLSLGVLPHTVPATPTTMHNSEEQLSLLDKIDAAAPAPLKTFDAFPKLPSAYRTRSSERGILTLFIAFIAFLLVANDIAEFVWGWPDYEFGIDYAPASYLDVNVDLIVNMPCRCAKSFSVLRLSYKPSLSLDRRLARRCWRQIIPQQWVPPGWCECCTCPLLHPY
jgi:hypothetical protein